MFSFFRPGLLRILFIALLPDFACADPVPPLATIIQRVVARDEANQNALQSMQFHQDLKLERLDAHDQITQHQEQHLIVRPGAKPEVELLAQSGDDIAKDLDEASRQKSAEQAQNQTVKFAIKDVIDRFTVTFVGSEVLRGQPVYVLAFAPKPDQPYNSQTEKVLNHLTGKMWVRTTDANVLHTEATLAEPVNVAWIFAQITELNFSYDLNSTTEMGPAHIETLVQVNAPLFLWRQRIITELTDFKKRY